jgi:hypothetical protein
MIYLWSTNEYLGAQLIRWGGGDKSSHFAKYYPHLGTIVESRLDTGVREIPVGDWLKAGNKVIYALQPKYQEITDDILYNLDRHILGSNYDKKGVVFLALMTLIKRLWNKFTFKENKWGAKEDYFCVEILKTHDMPMFLNGVKPFHDWEAAYPEEVYEYFRKFPEVFSVVALEVS